MVVSSFADGETATWKLDELKFYDDCAPAYHAALASITQAEKAEQQMAENEAAAQEEEKAKGKKKSGMMSKVWKAVLTAITSTFATILGTYVSDKVTGKKTKSKTSRQPCQIRYSMSLPIYRYIH